MKKIVDLIIEELKPAFTGCGYDEKFIRVTLSNRPDLCEYQCHGGGQSLQKETDRYSE